MEMEGVENSASFPFKGRDLLYNEPCSKYTLTASPIPV